MTFPERFSNVDKLSALQQWLIVHSYLYYCTDKQIVTDKMFDHDAYQLVDLMKECSQEELEASKWWYVMYDWDGTTGFHLYTRLKAEDQHWVAEEANFAYSVYERYKEAAVY